MSWPGSSARNVINGVLFGTSHKEPVMATCVYEVHFLDDHTEELAEKSIAEALYAQCNPDGSQYVTLDSVVD